MASVFLDRLTPLAIVAMFEHAALPIRIRWNVTSMNVEFVASLSILNNTLRRLDEAKLALQKIAHHNDIIVNATQRHLNEVEWSTQHLCNHDVANALAVKTQHR
jgi:hypothetical protein